MRAGLRHAVWLATVALGPSPTSVLAQTNPPTAVLYAITLDMDNDGALDRAVMAQDPGDVGADLSIYLGAGNQKAELSRKPSFLKKDLTMERVLGMESRGKGSLVVTYGCGGCSNDDETTLTIVDRGGRFLVAGVTRRWDTRRGIGGCDIDFLTGTSLAWRGLGESRQVKGRFPPVKMTLADWSDERRPEPCKP